MYFSGDWLLTPIVAKVCQEQKETGEADAMFVLEDGATLSNVRARQTPVQP